MNDAKFNIKVKKDYPTTNSRLLIYSRKVTIILLLPQTVYIRQRITHLTCIYSILSYPGPKERYYQEYR